MGGWGEGWVRGGVKGMVGEEGVGPCGRLEHVFFFLGGGRWKGYFWLLLKTKNKLSSACHGPQRGVSFLPLDIENRCTV